MKTIHYLSERKLQTQRHKYSVCQITMVISFHTNTTIQSSISINKIISCKKSYLTKWYITWIMEQPLPYQFFVTKDCSTHIQFLFVLLLFFQGPPSIWLWSYFNGSVPLTGKLNCIRNWSKGLYQKSI